MTDSNGPSGLASLVPNIEYDLIARIIPGALSLFLVFKISWPIRGAPAELLYFFVGSYLAGLLLEKVSVLLDIKWLLVQIESLTGLIVALMHWVRRNTTQCMPPLKWLMPLFKWLQNCRKLVRIRSVADELSNDPNLWSLANQITNGGSRKIGKMFAELQLLRSIWAFCVIYGMAILLKALPRHAALRPYDSSHAYIFLGASVILSLFYWQHKHEIRKKVNDALKTRSLKKSQLQEPPQPA